jgi:DNA-binding beta-propeller fold protein YncE
VRGNIFVTDSKQGVVKIFKNAGKNYGGEIGKGILGRPTGIAVNEKTSELLVVDTLNAYIFRFDLADRKLKGKFGGSGKAEGALNFPTHICVNSDGIIFASDSLNFRIQAFTPEGKFLRSFGSIGTSPGHFSRPKGVAVDSDGNIYVVDGLFDNVQIFDRESRLLMAFGRPGTGYGEFWLPTGIFIDSNDRIYVSDSYNKRVQIFQYLKGNDALK